MTCGALVNAVKSLSRVLDQWYPIAWPTCNYCSGVRLSPWLSYSPRSERRRHQCHKVTMTAIVTALRQKWHSWSVLVWSSMSLQYTFTLNFDLFPQEVDIPLTHKFKADWWELLIPSVYLPPHQTALTPGAVFSSSWNRSNTWVWTR